MRYLSIFLLIVLGIFTGCSTVREVPAVKQGDFEPAEILADSILAELPDYSERLSSVKGKGKAIVSEPENSERVTLHFSSNRQKSLITVKNSLGIEGGELLTDGDTLLVYNKIDKYARKIPVRGGNLDNINNLASVNILDILNLPLHASQVEDVYENDTTWLLMLKDGSSAYVTKQGFTLRQIDRSQNSQLPYSQIKYEGYETIESLKLPRRITIFSADRSSKVDLLIQSLDVNSKLDELSIDLPDDINIYYR